MMTTTPSKAVSQKSSRLMPLLLIALIVVAGYGAYLWRSQHIFRQWLETASLEELAAAAPDHIEETELFVRLGIRAREAEQWPRAAKAFQHAAELAPDRREAWVGWARSTYDFADFRAADVILSDFIRRHTNDGQAFLERAAMRRDAKQRESAFDDADKATQLIPNSGEAWALRGDLCLDAGIPGEGENNYQKARKLMPDSPWPHVGLYQAFIAQKKDAEALEMAQTISSRFKEVKEGALYLGEAQVASAKTSEEFDVARKTLKEAMGNEKELRPMDQFSVNMLFGQSYYNQQRFAEAKPYLEKAEDTVSGNPDLLFLLGRTYRALGETSKADATLTRHREVYENTAKIRHYQARVKDDPTNAGLRMEFARWYAAHGYVPAARTQYEEMILRGLDVDAAKKAIEELDKNAQKP